MCKERLKSISKNIFKWIYIILIQSLQTILIASIAVYFNRLYEFILIVIGFQIGKSVFGDTYHASTLILCTIMSVIIFGLACLIVPESNISLILQIILGVFISYVMNIVECIKEELNGGER